jgi:hypothetical protein
MPNRTKDDGYKVTVQPNGDRETPDRPWGRIVEVSVQDIPGPNAGEWGELARELLLRLEKTPPDKALAIFICDTPTLKRAIKTLSAYFRKHHGKTVVRLASHVFPDGTSVLYIRRGENWSRRREPDDDRIPTGDDLPLDSEPIEEETHEQENPNGRRRGRPRRNAQRG